MMPGRSTYSGVLLSANGLPKTVGSNKAEPMAINAAERVARLKV